MFGILVQGRSSYEEIDLFRFNHFFKKVLSISNVPARETLRLYLVKIAAMPNILDCIRACNTRILKHATINPVEIQRRNYIPVDIDVSTPDNSSSNKELISFR